MTVCSLLYKLTPERVSNLRSWRRTDLHLALYVCFKREADIMTILIYTSLFVVLHMSPNLFENIFIYIAHITR